jgi:hypothetical protein
MLTVYQEQIPFTNKRLDKQISKDQAYTNPVIMPFAFNATSAYNSLETVIYIRNNNPSVYYTGIVVCLMSCSTSDGIASTGTVLTGATTSTFTLPSVEPITFDNAFEETNPGDTVILDGQYLSSYTPVTKDSTIEVKFSYGYDELSNYAWSIKNSGLYIPYIGNSSLYDMSYIPIRMRINFFSEPSLYTIRDYFIDVSYANEYEVTG